MGRFLTFSISLVDKPPDVQLTNYNIAVIDDFAKYNYETIKIWVKVDSGWNPLAIRVDKIDNFSNIHPKVKEYYKFINTIKYPDPVYNKLITEMAAFNIRTKNWTIASNIKRCKSYKEEKQASIFETLDNLEKNEPRSKTDALSKRQREELLTIKKRHIKGEYSKIRKQEQIKANDI